MAKNDAFPPESREHAAELYHAGGVSMDAMAKQLGVSSTTIANWLRQARIDHRELSGVSISDRTELAQLRCRIRQLEKENEILKRAIAHVAKANVLPERCPGWPAGSPRPADGTTKGTPKKQETPEPISSEVSYVPRQDMVAGAVVSLMT